MITFFRSFFQSKFGIAITLGFLALIAFAFASADVATTGTFGGVSGGDRVAVVGNKKISTSELTTNANNALNRARQEDPTITMDAFIARGGMEEVLAQLFSRTAISEFGDEYGLRAGKKLVDSEIRQIDAFRNVSGNFDQENFRAALRQRGLTEASVRDDLAMGLMARQVITPVSYAPQLPLAAARRYAQLLREERRGSIAVLPSALYAPEGAPTAERLQAYYTANRADFIRPERRVIRYAAFGEEAVGNLPPPTAAQIAARFERDNAQYAALESRRFTQLVLPTQAAAQALAAEVAGGKSLVLAAQEKGLATTTLGPVTRQQLAAGSSAQVAQAGFAAARGSLSAPAQGSLGWYVLQVEDVENRAARSLAQVGSEIAAALAVEQRTDALNELTSRLERDLDSGRGLGDVAEEIGLELQTTAPLTAAGQIYGRNEGAPQLLAPVLAVAFEMSEGEPQLAATVPGEQFLMFDIADITPSATAPLAEIRDDVTAAWRQSEGQRAASAAAGRVMERLTGGSTIAQALAAEDVPLPPADAVSLSRQQISQQGQVPPVLALLFSMAEGTVKRLEAPSLAGWFVVQLDVIDIPDLDPADPLVQATQTDLSSVVGEEYLEQFINAIEVQVGVTRNQPAIDAVIAQLTGTAN